MDARCYQAAAERRQAEQHGGMKGIFERGTPEQCSPVVSGLLCGDLAGADSWTVLSDLISFLQRMNFIPRE